MTHLTIIGIVTLYNPDMNVAVSNIHRYAPYLDQLIVWDNSPISHQSQLSGGNILYHWTGENTYIAPAINYAWQYAKEHKFDLILIMDQDSSWTNFQDFRNHVEQLASTHPNYGAFCPKVDNVYCWTSIMPVQPIRLFINSGTVIRTDVLSQIHGADTRFPLDALDNDLSIRIQQAGYQPVCLTDFHLCHELGHPMRSKILHLYSSNYNALRTYSIMRGYTLFLRIHHKWLKHSEIYTILKEYFFWKPVRIVFMEPDKWQRTKSYIKGIIDGLNIKI